MPPVTSSTDLALAQQHDAAGRHSDAINALARGTRAGNLPCMTQLGKRLLAGDRAPLLAPDGARFLLDAANQGDGEAAARIAALTALGLYRVQSWRGALRWLVVAFAVLLLIGLMVSEQLAPASCSGVQAVSASSSSNGCEHLPLEPVLAEALTSCSEAGSSFSFW